MSDEREAALTASGLYEAKPQHPWNDPDGDGHNCVDCDRTSVWKCDEAAHASAPDAYLRSPCA